MSILSYKDFGNDKSMIKIILTIIHTIQSKSL